MLMKKKMGNTFELRLASEKAYPISRTLYGIFLEDIGFAVDGGLNANVVNNYSFDGEYMDPMTLAPVSDPLRYWKLDGGTMASCSEDGVGGCSKYARLNVQPDQVLVNEGFHGGHYGDRPAVSIQKNAEYVFSCFARCDGFDGTIRVRVRDANGTVLAEQGEGLAVGSEWKRVQREILGRADGYGRLEIVFDAAGTVDLDVIEFYNKDTWHAGDEKWRHGRFRKDLVEALSALHPAFMRFPGGCIVEGMDPQNAYHWKDTVGELWDRRPKYDLWAEKQPDGGYCQSYQIGFYEYFCLCEDLKMRPLPTLNAGLACQIRKRKNHLNYEDVPADSEAFEKEIVADYLDLIDFAKGDPEKSEWAALRAKMGHPKPFFLDRIGIGNENFGKEYHEKFAKIAEAVTRKDPSVRVVMCGGFMPFRAMLAPDWRFIRKGYPNAILDEHSYHSPEWFKGQVHRFDRYPRRTSTVYMGEYSANGLMAGQTLTIETTNTMASALGEAAFMIGMEKNGDVVEMSSYAPLFNLIDSENWFSNLIDFNPAEVCPSANYYNQQLFGKYYGPVAVPLEGKLPEGVHKGVYASATKSDDTLYLKVVNTSPQAVTITVTGLESGVSAAEGEILSQEDLTAKNRLSFEGSPACMVMLKPVSYEAANGRMVISVPAQSIQGIAVPFKA